MYAPTLYCKRAVDADGWNNAFLSAQLDISLYCSSTAALSTLLYCIHVLSVGHFIKLGDTEQRSRASHDHKLLSLAGFWSVYVTSCQWRVMYNSAQILFRLKCKTCFNWDLVTTDTWGWLFRTCDAYNVVDKDTYVTSFPDLQYTNICERNYIRYHAFFTVIFLKYLGF